MRKYSFKERVPLCINPAAQKLLRIMEQKKATSL